MVERWQDSVTQLIRETESNLKDDDWRGDILFTHMQKKNVCTYTSGKKKKKKQVVFSIDDSALCVFLTFLGPNFSNARLNEKIHKKM